MVVIYDCPYQHKLFLLIFKNDLHVPSMNHNLISPFIMEEAGMKVYSKPQIHSDKVTVAAHAFYDAATDLRVPFKLRGLFSYFKTRYLTSDEIMNCSTSDTVYLLPDSNSWNPANPIWAEQEDVLLDSRGEVPFHTIKQPSNSLVSKMLKSVQLKHLKPRLTEC